MKLLDQLRLGGMKPLTGTTTGDWARAQIQGLLGVFAGYETAEVEAEYSRAQMKGQARQERQAKDDHEKAGEAQGLCQLGSPSFS